jgi:hypothetical protein
VLDFVDKPGVEDAYSIRDVSSGGDSKDAFFKESSDFSLARSFVVDVVL